VRVHVRTGPTQVCGNSARIVRDGRYRQHVVVEFVRTSVRGVCAILYVHDVIAVARDTF
jgi:hypothetical protein